MTEDEIQLIEDIFWTEAPYDYALDFSAEKRKNVRGLCSYEEKVCIIYGETTFLDSLWVLLHELAHAKVQHNTHSNTWDEEFVRLLDKYEYPKNLVEKQAEAIGPNLRKWANLEVTRSV